MRGKRSLGARLGSSSIVLLLALTLTPLAAWAERPPRARPVSREAQAQLDGGNRLFRIREFAKAIEAYKAGALLEDVPLFHWNLGQAYRMAGLPTEAVWHYELFLRHVAADDPDRGGVEGLLARTKAAMKDAAPAASGNKVASSTEKPPARAPAPKRSAPAAPAAPAPAKGSGELVVMVKPWAAIWLDGKSLNDGTPYRAKVAAGRHRLRLANEDLGQRESLTITIKANETTIIERKW